MSARPFNIARPCSDCPFRREGGIRLTRGRVREIVRAVTTNPGTSFHCHKTTGVDGDGEACSTDSSLFCAGALIFAEKQGKAINNQLVRIMERVGAYDAKTLMEQPDVAEIFDSEREMLKTAIK